jgi:hypothetical protein
MRCTAVIERKVVQNDRLLRPAMAGLEPVPDSQLALKPTFTVEMRGVPRLAGKLQRAMNEK